MTPFFNDLQDELSKELAKFEGRVIDDAVKCEIKATVETFMRTYVINDFKVNASYNTEEGKVYIDFEKKVPMIKNKPKSIRFLKSIVDRINQGKI